MRTIERFFYTSTATLYSFLVTGLFAQVFAQQLNSPIGNITIEGFLLKLVGVIILIAVPIIVLAIIFAGFKFVTAGGNAEEIKKARIILWWAVIGALIILGAQVLATAIKQTVTDITTRLDPEDHYVLTTHPLLDILS